MRCGGQDLALALTNATLPYAVEIANKGRQRASVENKETRLGLNIVAGKVTFRGMADAFGLDCVDAGTLISRGGRQTPASGPIGFLSRDVLHHFPAVTAMRGRRSASCVTIS